MHKNGLFISGRRVVLEPWLVYFRGKENEKQRIASRAITDVGSILETSKMSINDIYDAYMDNIEDLHISFPEEYQSLIDKTYAKYFTSA